MRKLLITGNSHGGVLRAAWNALSVRPEGLEVDFLNIGAKHFAHMGVSPEGRFGITDESILATLNLPEYRKIDGALSCDLRNYSHVLVAGSFSGTSMILRMLADHRVDLIRESPAGLPRLSQQAYLAFSQAIALQRLPLARIDSFKPWCKVGLFLAPRLSERILDDPEVSPYLKAIAQDPAGVPEALALIETALQGAIAEKGAKLFAVPVESLAASGLTRAEFSRDITLPTATGLPDYEHMNEAYGALCLGPIIEWALA